MGMDTCKCWLPKKKLAKMCLACRRVQDRLDIERRKENMKEKKREYEKKYRWRQKILICSVCGEKCETDKIFRAICDDCRKLAKKRQAKEEKERFSGRGTIFNSWIWKKKRKL